MKKITFSNVAALLFVVFSLCSCGKESTNTIHQLEDHVEGHEAPDIEAMEMTQANLGILNFDVENGILTFETLEDLKTYRQEVSILTDQKRNEFEAKHGFTSLRSITQKILDKSSNINSEAALSAFMEEHKDYVELLNNSLDGKYTTLSISLNENRFVKLGDIYNYYDEEKIMASSKLEDLKLQINNPDLQINGVDISFYKDFEVSNLSIVEDRDDNIFHNDCMVTFLGSAHDYTGNGKKRRMRLSANYVEQSIYMISGLEFWTEFQYELTNKQKFGIFWFPKAVGLLGEYNEPSLSQFSSYDVTNKISSVLSMPENFDPNSNFNNFDYIYGSCWGPSWHRSGCN